MSKKKDNNAEEKEEKDLEKDSLESAESENQTENADNSEKSEAETDGISDQLKKKDEKIASLRDQLLRNMAEYDNYRKRTSRERIELEPEISAKIVTEFLTVADSLERALAADCSDENYKKGVQMIYDSFMETMNKLGVEQIPTEGDFDPSVHQAVQQVPGADGQESGQIAATFQKGYKIGNRVLRFAMVAVVA
ncbi:MAG: nucleotide exchange factor GrpE [Ruminococcaceae bacterium]|nr:nucleotide exchange factor GrpE [Oscillospiraceae bacterium]